MLERFGEWDALILHYNIRRVWIVPAFGWGHRAQCGRSPRCSALPLAMVWSLAGDPLIWGIKCWNVWGGGDASIIHFKSRRASLVSYFSFFFWMFLENIVIVCAYQKRTTQQSTMTGIIFWTFIHCRMLKCTLKTSATSFIYKFYLLKYYLKFPFK